MKNGKFAKRGVASKSMAMILALVLVVGCTVGGTLAYLVDHTAKVENTFTVGNVDITLKETKLTEPDKGLQEGVKNEYKLVPGQTYPKDPTVSVLKGSEPCYLFVKFEENGNAATYIEYTSNLTETNGWKTVSGETNVWYREVPANATEDQTWELLADNKIVIRAEAVTKDTMDTAKGASLVYTAYACQSANISVDNAWTQVKNLG